MTASRRSAARRVTSGYSCGPARRCTRLASERSTARARASTAACAGATFRRRAHSVVLGHGTRPVAANGGVGGALVRRDHAPPKQRGEGTAPTGRGPFRGHQERHAAARRLLAVTPHGPYRPRRTARPRGTRRDE